MGKLFPEKSESGFCLLAQRIHVTEERWAGQFSVARVVAEHAGGCMFLLAAVHAPQEMEYSPVLGLAVLAPLVQRNRSWVSDEGPAQITLSHQYRQMGH